MPLRTFLLSLAILVPASILHADSYTYPQLVERLTDLSELAKLPPDGEKTALASSYDRHSKYDAAGDKYIDWDANGDGTGIVAKEGDQSVLADIQGPGCIWRIWSATAQEGHVKIYSMAPRLRPSTCPSSTISAARPSRSTAPQPRLQAQQHTRRAARLQQLHPDPVREVVQDRSPIPTGATTISSPIRRFRPAPSCPRSKWRSPRMTLPRSTREHDPRPVRAISRRGPAAGARPMSLP